MSGPNDSGAGDTPTGDFKLPAADAAPNELSPRFRLHLNWDAPRLEWRPTLADKPLRTGEPAFLRLDDPFGSLLDYERYIQSGQFLFDMRRPDFAHIEKAFLDAPTKPPDLLPSFAQMKAWEDDAFYRRLGRTAPLFGAPATPSLILAPPLSAPPAVSPFYKLPDPSAMQRESGPPKAGGFGDIAKAFMGLPIVKLNIEKLEGFGLWQAKLLKQEWDQAPWRDRITAITLTATLAAGVVGTVLGASDARHFAFGLMKGVNIPVPFVPGLKFHVDDFGKADPFLLSKPDNPNQPQPLKFGLTLDVLEAIPALKKRF